MYFVLFYNDFSMLASVNRYDRGNCTFYKYF